MKYLMKVATILAAGLAASSALAVSTYHYSGKVNPTNSRDGGIVNYVGLHSAMTFEFTIASPLAANLGSVELKASALSWTASAGLPTSTITSGDPHASLGRLRLTTDATGAITHFFIVVSATDPALPTRLIQGQPYGVSPSFLFDHAVGPGADSVRFIEDAFGQNTGGAVCGTTCGQAGTFVLVPPAPAGGVPEPVLWGMLVAGFGLVGTARRARRASAAA